MQKTPLLRILTYMPGRSYLASNRVCCLNEICPPALALLRRPPARIPTAFIRLNLTRHDLFGDWKFEIKGFGLGVSSDRRKVLRGLSGGSHGKIALLIDTRA